MVERLAHVLDLRAQSDAQARPARWPLAASPQISEQLPSCRSASAPIAAAAAVPPARCSLALPSALQVLSRPPPPAAAQVRASGLVVNSMGWVSELGYELLLHTLSALKCGVVLVVGDERLYSQLSGEMRKSGTGVQVRGGKTRGRKRAGS